MITYKKVRLVLETQRIAESEVDYSTTPLSTSNKVAAIAQQLIGNDVQEVFIVFMLSTKNKIMAIHEVSRGGINAATVAPSEVFRAAILSGSISIIVSHNHPSGDLMPSAEDIALTSKIVSAGQLLRINVLDHVIVTQSAFYSFGDNGLIK